jgi:hypothetical protein
MYVVFSSNTHHRRKCATCALPAASFIRTGVIRWVIFIGSFFVPLVGVIRWIILLVVCGHLCPFMWVILLGEFHVGWNRSEDLVCGFLEGNFCTVERL